LALNRCQQSEILLIPVKATPPIPIGSFGKRRRSLRAVVMQLRAALLTRCDEEATSVHDVRGKIEALVANDRDRAGFAVSVTGRLGLICQSCGAGFELPVDSLSTIYVARDSAELERWEDESFESIEANEKTSALELIEDELLLAIPYVPRCEKCSADDTPKIHEFN
jgi:uncharacterized metal-binding protein YceD (DUF177 family)